MENKKVVKETYLQAWRHEYGGALGASVSAIIFSTAGVLAGGFLGHVTNLPDDGNKDPKVESLAKTELHENLQSLVQQERSILSAELLLKEKMSAQILLGIANADTRQLAEQNLVKAKADFETAKTAFSVRLLTDMHVGEDAVKDISEEAIGKLSTSFPSFYQTNNGNKEAAAFYSRGLRECQADVLGAPEKYNVTYGNNVKTAEAVSLCSHTEGHKNIDAGILTGLGAGLALLFAIPAIGRREIKPVPVPVRETVVDLQPPEKPKKKLRLES